MKWLAAYLLGTYTVLAFFRGLGNRPNDNERWIWRLAFCAIVALLCFGCKSASIMATQVFPQTHAEQCRQAYAEAWAIVESVEGTPKKRGLHVKLKPATRNFNGYWAWYEENSQYSEWVMGTTSDYGRTITAAVDPHGNVHHGMLVHEMGHHLRIVTWGKYDHDPRYDGRFFNWAGARHVYGKGRSAEVVR